MIIVFKPNAPQEAKLKVRAKLENHGFVIHESNGLNITLYGIVGDTSAFDMRTLIADDCIEKIMRVQEPLSVPTVCSIRKIALSMLAECPLVDARFRLLLVPVLLKAWSKLQVLQNL